MNIPMNNQDQKANQTDLAQPQNVSVTGPGGKEQAPVNPFVVSSEAPPAVGELKEFGVNVLNQERPQISEDIAQMGVSHAGPSVPAPATLSNIELSSADRQVASKASWTDSIRGLLELIVKKEKKQGGVV